MTGGRHGYGAKLTNIFSKLFQVETYDKAQNLLYTQTWKTNMTEVSPPSIVSPKKTKTKENNFTKITFTPDLEKFGYSKESSDQVDGFIQIAIRRAYDIAATVSPITVSINGKKLDIKSFRDYVNLFASNMLAEENAGETSEPTIEQRDLLFHVDVNDRWSVSVMKSPSGEFENISFVNSVWTSRYP